MYGCCLKNTEVLVNFSYLQNNALMFLGRVYAYNYKYSAEVSASQDAVYKVNIFIRKFYLSFQLGKSFVEIEFKRRLRKKSLKTSDNFGIEGGSAHYNVGKRQYTIYTVL